MAEMENSYAFQEKLEKAESLDAVVRACAEKGITITKEQIEALMSSDPEGELSAEALDSVSGGGVIDWIRRYFHRSRAPGGGSIGGR